MSDRPLEPAFANEDPEGWCEIAVWEAERADAAEKRIAELERELENARASGIHSCGEHCQRPLCVMRRERDEAVALLRLVRNWERNRCKKGDRPAWDSDVSDYLARLDHD